MKRVISLILSFSLILMMGCSKNEVDTLATNDVLPQFSGLNDKNLLRYAEDIIYQETVKGLSNDEYFVENVSTSFFGNSAERSATDIIELLTLKNDYGVDESVLSSLDSQSEIVEFKTNIEDKYKNLREKALETLDVRKEVEYDEI